MEWEIEPADSGELVAYVTMEDPSIPTSKADDLLYNGGSASSESGIAVYRHDVALGISAVWQAINMISSDVAKLPLVMYERGDDDTRERVFDHPAAFAVRKEPSRGVTAFKFWRRLMVHLLLYNRAYAWIRRERSGITLIPLVPDTVSIQDYEGQTFYMTYGMREGEFRPAALYPEEVLHLEGISIDCVDGEDWLKHARDTVGLALAQQRFASVFFKRGGRIGGVLELPSSMTPKAKDVLEQGFKRRYEGFDAAFQTVVLRDNAKFHAGQFSPEAAQLTEGRKEQTREIARRFNLRPSKLGEDATTSYASKAEDNRDYLDTTLNSHLTQIAEECSLKLLSVAEYREDRYYFEHNTDRLLQLDPLARAQQYDYLRRNGIISPNEARKRENLPLRTDPGGNAFDNPNISPSQSQQEGDPEDDGGEDIADNGSNRNRRARAAHAKLLGEALDRMLRVATDKVIRASEKGNEFPKWIDSRLPGVVLTVAEGIEPIFEAHCAIVGANSKEMAARAYAIIQREIVTICDACCSKHSADSLRMGIAAQLADAPQRITELVIASTIGPKQCAKT